MKKYFFLLFFISFLFQKESFSQDIKSVPIYQPKKNRKTLGYLSTAKKGLKNKDYFKAIANASCALNSKPKKRQVKKINGVMEKGYANFLQETQKKIDELKKTSAKVETDEHVMQRRQISNRYKELIFIQDELAKVPTDLINKIKITVEETDHSTSLASADKSLEEGIKEIIEIHYLLGKEMLEKSTNRMEYKNTGRQLAKIFRYKSTYKDVTDLYKKAKEKGTTKMSVHFFDRTSSKLIREMKGAELESKITQNLYEKVKVNSFFTLYPNDGGGMVTYNSADGMDGYNKALNEGNHYRDKTEGIHYQLTGIILDCEVIHKQEDEEPKTKTKTIKKGEKTSDGKDSPGVKVTAKLKTYSKTSYATITVSYKIIDIATGKVIMKSNRLAGTDDWFYSWATYTGDKRALSSHDQSFVKQKPKNPPADAILIEGASKKLAERIAKEVQGYINSKDL